MSEAEPNTRSVAWQGDMCFGVVSTKSNSTTLTASPEGLNFSGPLGKTFYLHASKVRQVETGKSSVWFLSGLRTGCIQILHDMEGVPKELLFSAKGIPATEIAQELKRLGYRVP